MSRPLGCCLTLAFLLIASTGGAAGGTRYDVLDHSQKVVVKVYGSGGMAGLEGYQSGVFLRGKPTRVLSTDSAVLEEDSVALVDAFGERCEGRLLGRDAATGLSLIECPEAFSPPATIDLDQAASPRPGQRVWVLSNAFGIATGDEAVTVQRGRLGAIAPMPTSAANVGSGYRPTIGAPAAGTRVLLLDAVTSNPGTGGGVVFSHRGDVLGVLGAECRSPSTGAWINYALPASAAAKAVGRILERAGDARQSLIEPRRQRAREVMQALGLKLIPPITRRAPAYIEYVAEGGPAARAGCLPDDLIVAVSGATVGTVETAERALAAEWGRSGRVELLVLRENRLVTLQLEGDAP